jgi:hypothetical protein
MPFAFSKALPATSFPQGWNGRGILFTAVQEMIIMGSNVDSSDFSI